MEGGIHMAKCLAFEMDDLRAAWKHMKLEVVEDYGDHAYGHYLHCFDDGKRELRRCKTCGGYVLVQKSEFHSFSDGNDDYYTDYYPVEDVQEADEINRNYNGDKIEDAFPSSVKCIRMTNLILHWSGQAPRDGIPISDFWSDDEPQKNIGDEPTHTEEYTQNHMADFPADDISENTIYSAPELDISMEDIDVAPRYTKKIAEPSSESDMSMECLYASPPYEETLMKTVYASPKMSGKSKNLFQGVFDRIFKRR